MAELDWLPVVEREPEEKEKKYPPRPEPYRPGSWSGMIEKLMGAPSPEAVKFEEQRGTYGPTEEQRASTAILQRVAEMKSEDDARAMHIPPQQLFQKLLKDPTFITNALMVKDPTKLVADVQGLLFKEPGKPVVIPEGGLLSTPEGEALLKNPKVHDKVETETAKITVRKAYDLLGKVSEEGTSAQEDLANISVLITPSRRTPPACSPHFAVRLRPGVSQSRAHLTSRWRGRCSTASRRSNVSPAPARPPTRRWPSSRTPSRPSSTPPRGIS
jgi:hypothetical protein